MATDLTSNYSIPFPKPGDPVNVAGDMQDLAERIDDVLYAKTSNNFINTFSAPQIVEILTDPVGVTPVPSAFRITQSGTGAALLVTVGGNPGTSPFIINNSGNVGVGTITPSTKLDVNGTITGTLFSGSGASLTSLNGSNISSGTVADARIASSIARLNSPNFTTPDIGVATATSINGTTIPTSKTLLITDNIGSTVQGWDADLDSIAGLAGTTGLLKKTAANTWTLDTAAYSTTVGTVTSVGVSVPTGLSVTNTPVTSSGTITIALQSGYSIPTTASQTTWDTAYTDRNKWDGGSTGLVASTGRTSLGATTVGSNIFTLTNPAAITFLKINADNSVSTESAATFRSSIGLGSVENTALSTWAGSTNITTLGTIASGTWNATAIGVTKGGLGLTAGPTANGQIPIGSSTGSYTLATISAGSGISITNGSGTISIANAGVISVGLSLPSIFTVSNSPVTTTGTLTATLATQSINTVFAGPSTGSAAAPTFRTLVDADIPAAIARTAAPTFSGTVTMTGPLIMSGGVEYFYQVAPATFSGGGGYSPTPANLLTGIIQSTANGQAINLPTGTTMDTSITGLSTNVGFDWSVINGGNGTYTMTASTGHTYVGNASVLTLTSARFRSVRTATNTWVTYRLS